MNITTEGNGIDETGLLNVWANSRTTRDGRMFLGQIRRNRRSFSAVGLWSTPLATLDEAVAYFVQLATELSDMVIVEDGLTLKPSKVRM